MKNAILVHGTGGSGDDYFWFEDTKQYLEDNGYEVWWQLLPNTKKPVLKETVNFLIENTPGLDDETIIIGHSSACPAILHWLDGQDQSVKQVILVGGFYEIIDDSGYSELMLPESFNWESIRKKAIEIILINSDNDPWGCNDKQARQPAIEMGAKLVINSNQGHMGSLNFNQPYKEFSLLKRLLDVQT